MTQPPSYLDESRAFWKVAATFPPDKETVYPDHGWAHQFDRLAGLKVLEYGCGGGSDTVSLLRRGASVFFADIVPENVMTTRRRIEAIWRGPAGLLASKAFPITLAASDDLPLPDAHLDAITSHGVLHHVIEPAPVLAAFHRVLKPGGVAYVMLYTEHLAAYHEDNVQILMETHGLSREAAFGACTDGPGAPYARPYSEAEGVRLLADAGFVVEATACYVNLFFRTFRARKEA